MTIAHRLTGYDKVTDRLVIAHEIPVSKMPQAIEIADVPATDRDAIGVYPLTREQALNIASFIETDINMERYDWFFEPTSVALELSHS